MNSFYYYNRFIEKVLDTYWNIYNKINLKLWNCKIGKNCKFQGKSHFRRYPESIITIGDDCQFISAKYGNFVGIYTPCQITTLLPNSSITIGRNCGFSATVITAAKSVRIGNNVRCGANTLITDTDFHTDDQRAGADKEVVIEDNVWLGYGVKILKGVHIGANSIIGLGSIVTHDIPANVVAVGNPCKVIKELKIQ